MLSICLMAILAGLMAAYTAGVMVEAGRQASATLRAQNEAFRAAENASRMEAARLMAERERDDMARSMEEAANADKDASRLCLGPDSVMRLNKR